MAGDRSRIEALRREIVEERIRAEVRAEIARVPAKSIAARIWAAFNTPFCLFILSSVVLTAVSQRFAEERNDAVERSTRRTGFFKLFTELEYRITRLERDEARLGEIGQDNAAAMKAIGRDAIAVVTGEAPDAISAPEYRNTYLGTIINQIELTAGLPANRELTPVVEALVIDDCETAAALHGELNVLRKWVELRIPLVDAGKLPKIPTFVMPAADQAALVMPSYDMLRSEDGSPEEASTRAKIAALVSACNDLG